MLVRLQNKETQDIIFSNVYFWKYETNLILSAYTSR